MSESKELVKAETSVPVVLEQPDEALPEIVVAATNPAEMAVAQKGLIDWAERKIAATQVEVKDLEENLAVAQKRKWKTEPWKKRVYAAQRQVEYYEKVKAALEAGFCLVPNFPNVDVFAIRTSRQSPKRNETNWQPNDQKTNSPALGEGRYVNATALTASYTTHEKMQDGKTKTITHRYADSFDAVDFPFAFAKAKILDDTGRAMALKIFDDIAVLPARRKKADPIVIGRILRREGYDENALTFLISWFIDTRYL